MELFLPPLPGVCTCQPCGCDTRASCSGTPGCTSPDCGGIYEYGGAVPPEKRPSLYRFDGETALVTGGASGMGFSTALALAAECATVHICGRNRVKGQQAQEALTAAWRKAAPSCKVAAGAPRFTHVDVSNITQVKLWVASIGNFSRVVLNAGVSMGGPLTKYGDEFLDMDFWNNVIRINLYGMLYSMKAVLEHWEGVCKAGGRCSGYAMLVRGSNTAVSSAPTFSVYGASKAGDNALCKSVAAEYNPPVQGIFPGDSKLNVRINCVSPGPINTPMLRNGFRALPLFNLQPHQCLLYNELGIPYMANGEADGPGTCYDISSTSPLAALLFWGTSTFENTRVSSGDEVAAVDLFLLSDAASGIRGFNHMVDDGFTVARPNSYLPK